jgi:hypothetical protein
VARGGRLTPLWGLAGGEQKSDARAVRRHNERRRAELLSEPLLANAADGDWMRC